MLVSISRSCVCEIPFVKINFLIAFSVKLSFIVIMIIINIRKMSNYSNLLLLLGSLLPLILLASLLCVVAILIFLSLSLLLLLVLL